MVALFASVPPLDTVLLLPPAGTEKAPVALRKAVAPPVELVPRAEVGITVVAEPRAETMWLPDVALLAMDRASEPAVLVTSAVCAGSALVGSVVTGLVGANGVVAPVT